MLEYGRHVEFALYVNGDTVDLADIPGETFEFSGDLPEAGHVQLRFTVAEDRFGRHGGDGNTGTTPD